MIYCYGLIEKYEAALDRGDFLKRGYTSPFRAGGDVFRTYEDEWQVLAHPRRPAPVVRVPGPATGHL